MPVAGCKGEGICTVVPRMCYECSPLDGDIYPVILDAAWLGENKEQLFPTVNEMMNTLMSIYALHTHATNERDHVSCN